MVSIFFIYSFVLYAFIECIIRKRAFNFSCRDYDLQLSKWKKGKEILIFISPGYWFARYYKNKIVTLCIDKQSIIRKKYLKVMNRLNLYITLFITMIYLMLAHFDASSALLLTGLLLFRFMSRVFEISYAFTADVLSNKNRSRLNKNERIKLAVFSYIELFFLSAPVYLILGVACDSLSAISVSLSVGTLTNIGLVVFNGASMLSNVVFVQVFATLSLVVFSLAMYLSREN